jgi:hypothetical protein
VLEIILQVVGSVLAIAASALGVISFWRDRIRHRTWFILGAIFFGAAATYLYATIEERRHSAEIKQLQEQALRRDASVVSDSIVISGWEGVGDYVGHLTQLTGFYKRHSDQYHDEYSTYARQLQEWQDYLKKARDSGKTPYSTDWEGLRGLVTSGRDHLKRIARAENSQ